MDNRTDEQLLADYHALEQLVADQKCVGIHDGMREHRLDKMRAEMNAREQFQLIRDYNS